MKTSKKIMLTLVIVTALVFAAGSLVLTSDDVSAEPAIHEITNENGFPNSSALVDGDIYKVMEDLELAGGIYWTGHNVTVDLNGHVITITTNEHVFNVGDGMSLTVIDSNPTAPHKGVLTEGRWSPSDTGNVIINGGIIYAYGGISAYEGDSITINGGNILQKSYEAGKNAISLPKAATKGAAASLTFNKGMIAYFVGEETGAISAATGAVITIGDDKNEKTAIIHDCNVNRGAISADASTIIIHEGAWIYDCISGRGTISTNDVSKIVMDGGIIDNCDGTGEGGAIHVNGVTNARTDSEYDLEITGGKISNCNLTTGKGGAIFLGAKKISHIGGTVEIEGCSAVDGGAILSYGQEFLMDGGTITNCEAVTGGAFRIQNCVFTFEGTAVIDNCRAIKDSNNKYGNGGAFWICGNGSVLNIDGGTIKNCSANGADGKKTPVGGGAILIQYDATETLNIRDGSVFQPKEADRTNYVVILQNSNLNINTSVGKEMDLRMISFFKRGSQGGTDPVIQITQEKIQCLEFVYNQSIDDTTPADPTYIDVIPTLTDDAATLVDSTTIVNAVNLGSKTITVADGKKLTVSGDLTIGNGKVTLGNGSSFVVAETGKVEKGTITFNEQIGSNVAKITVANGGVLGYISTTNGYINEHPGATGIYSYGGTSNGSVITAQDITGAFTISVDRSNALEITGEVNAVPATNVFKSVPRLGLYGVAAECVHNVTASDLTVASGVCVFARGVEIVGDVLINGIIFNEEQGENVELGLIIAEDGVLTIDDEGALRGYVSNEDGDFIVGMLGSAGQTGGSDTAVTYEGALESAGYGGFTLSYDGLFSYIEGAPVAGESIDTSTRPLYLYAVTVDDGGLAIGSDCVVEVLENEVLNAAGEITLLGTLIVGYNDGIALIGSIDVYEDATLSCDTVELIGANGIVVVDDGYINIVATTVGGAVTYTLNGDATVDEGGFFKSGDVISVPSGSTLEVENMTIPKGAKLSVAGTVCIDEDNILFVKETGTIDVKSTGVFEGAGSVSFATATVGSKVITAAQGASFTITLNGGQDADVGKGGSAIILKSIKAGVGGIVVSKGSVYIDGVLAIADANGKITVPAEDIHGNPNTVKITGVVDAGVTLEIEQGATTTVPAGGTLEIAAGASMTNNGTMDLNGAGSSVVYEKGSEVNGAVIEVTTKETKDGIEVTIKIYLVSENPNKLQINGPEYVEVFSGDSYADALMGITVTPKMKFVSFDGWYLIANNEKISLSQTVVDYDHSLKACFSEERIVPVDPDVPSDDDIVDDRLSFDIGLPLAFICLIASITVLGMVIVKKRK